MRDLGELKVVEAGTDQQVAFKHGWFSLAFVTRGAKGRSGWYLLRDYVGRMVNGAGDAVQQL